MNTNETKLSGMKMAVLVLVLVGCLLGVMGGCTVVDDSREPYLTIHGTTYPTRPAGPKDVANWLYIAGSVTNAVNSSRGSSRGHGHNGGCGNH